MRNFSILITAVLSTLVLNLAHAADNAAATVNAQPVKIKKAWLDIAKKDAQEAGRKFDEKAAVSNLITSELLSQEAVRLGIDKQQDFAVREEIKRRDLLASLYVKDYLEKNPISEEMIKAEYESLKAKPNKEYNARHIQLKSETEAKDIIAQLAKGADFAKLAKEKSQDARTKDKGGELGWFAKGTITPPLGDAASKLQKGLFTTMPLQSSAGWHVLKLEDVRDFQIPAYDKVKQQLRQRLKGQQIGKLIEELRAKAKTEITK